MSLGLWELVELPLELAQLAGRTLQGQSLRFWYDSQGTVTAIDLEGKPLYFLGAGQRLNKARPQSRSGFAP